MGAIDPSSPSWLLVVLSASYLIGSVPWAYMIVRGVTGEDITEHGSGNVGAMNVRRSTGSWIWFTIVMILDASKGIGPVLSAKYLCALPLFTPYGQSIGDLAAAPLPMVAVAGAVLGHNYSFWMALISRRFRRTGKGLATGGGALLAYDWRYFAAVVVVGLLIIAITRYMMAGQVAAAWTLPLTAAVLGSPDFPFALAMGVLVYAAHHKRFVGLLKGHEPRLYINDRMGPRG